ncbi:MAG TPA: signal peptidase I [Lachnospiraceae bacterium]|nr:signal peptidase I [Lachnospiraceae bacterium]
MSFDRKKTIIEYTLRKEGTKPKKKNKKLRRFQQMIILIAAAIVLGYAFVVFMFQTVKMVGPSMQGTINEGETVVISKIGKLLHGVKRNDVVAVKRSNDKYYSIKRVVGVPGDKVKISGGRLYINGEYYELKSGDIIVNPGTASSEIELLDNEYFLLGDNVNNSDDSRFSNLGIVQKTDITGIVVYRIKPWSKRSKIR